MAQRCMRQTLTLLGVLLWSGTGHAAPKDDARRHFMAGLDAASAGEYELALEEFLAAQDIYPHPHMLYNIARAYSDLGDLNNAIIYFELYAEAAPDKAADVVPMIQVLKARLSQAQPEDAAPRGAVGSVSSAELRRLQRLAEELAEISEQLTEQQAVAAEEVSTEPAESGTDTLPAVGEVGFISEVYERVVVTASRYGQRPLDSPSTISVITEQDIRMSGATSIPDLLRRAVGVEVMSLAASEPDVSIRGFNRELSNKVLVMIDGRSVYWDILATPLWGTLPISLDEIERIEITRGPGSAVYGANAVTGVVNIITKLPGEGENRLHLDGGQPAYSQGTLMTTGRTDRITYRVATGWHQTGRWSTAVEPEQYESLQLFSEDDSISLSTIRANGRLDRTFLDKGLVSISGGYLSGYSEFYAIGALGNYLLKDIQGGYARADVAYDKYLLRVYYNKLVATAGTWVAYSEPKQLITRPDSDTVDVELSGLWDLQTGPIVHRISAGTGYRYKRVEWSYLEGDGAPISENHYSAFLQEDARIGALSLIGAMRLDQHPLVPLSETISPRGAAVYRITDTTSVRMTGGTSFRSPSFIESYAELTQPNANEYDAITITTVGNQALVPERVLTGELGIRDESSSIHTADATIYVNRVTDLIGLSSLRPEISFYEEDINGYQVGTTTFLNEESVYTGYGLELDGHLFPINGLDVQANLHLQQIIEDTGVQQLTDESASAVKVNLSAAYASPWRVDISGGVHYVSAQTWRLREFDDTGSLVTESASIDARTFPTARIAVRPLPDDSLEIAGTVWNPAGLVEGGGSREHPKGQLVGGRAYASLIYRF